MIKDRMLDLAEVIDALRVVPRILLVSWMVFYMSYTWDLTYHYFDITDPSTQQTTFVTTVISALGTMSVWLGNIYINSRRKWEDGRLK